MKITIEGAKMEMKQWEVNDAVGFIADCAKDIEDFDNKIAPKGILRPAIKSHLCHLYRIEGEQAGELIALYLSRKAQS